MKTEAFTFLVTTDNHMGFKEDDAVRRKDSYMAFSEALSIARKEDVDFILLGGDLFHMNKPSPSIEHKCIKIIRQHMNEPATRGTSFKRIKGNFSHFHKVSHPNFEDPHLRVPYPIMTIHGNHDDPTGPNAQSVCLKLATCGLLNYFGALKPNVKSILVEPIIFQKGEVKIALYGLGFVSDFRLKQAFDNGEVTFLEPPVDTFNILVVHQNRIPFNKSKFIPDDLFPPIFHLIIRGHEHNAMDPEPITGSELGGLVYQPGSTVATSLSGMEKEPKKVGVFSIKTNDLDDPKNRFEVNFKTIKLNYCRQIIMKDIPQRDIYGYIKDKLGTRVTAGDFKRLSKEYVKNSLERLLKDEVLKRQDDNGNCDKISRLKLPLVRVRLEYSAKSERFDEFEVNSLFYPNFVANKDIIFYRKQKLLKGDDGEMINRTFIDCDDKDEEEYDEFECINLNEEKRDIDIMIETYFKDKPEDQRLQALSLIEYTNAVRATYEDGNVISKVLSKKKKDVQERYYRQIRSSKTFDDFMKSAEVDNWFLDCFKKNLDVTPKIEYIAIDEEHFDDDDSMDVIVCN